MGDGLNRSKTSGIQWDYKEKLDVTLERPDVTLYGLIELLVCHFVFFVLFYWGVCQNVCCCILLLFLRTVFSLYWSVILLNLQRCIIFFSNTHLCFTPPALFLSSSPPSSNSAEGSVCQSCHSCFEAGEKPTTTDRRNSLHQLPALKAPYLLPTQQEIEASDTSQMIKSIGSCTGPCKWLDFRCSKDSIQLFWIHP